MTTVIDQFSLVLSAQTQVSSGHKADNQDRTFENQYSGLVTQLDTEGSLIWGGVRVMGKSMGSLLDFAGVTPFMWQAFYCARVHLVADQPLCRLGVSSGKASCESKGGSRNMA